MTPSVVSYSYQQGDTDMKSLLKHPAVQEVDGEGLDDGRFFVHLKDGWDWCYDPHSVTRSKSFSSVKEAREWLKRIKRTDV